MRNVANSTDKNLIALPWALVVGDNKVVVLYSFVSTSMWSRGVQQPKVASVFSVDWRFREIIRWSRRSRQVSIDAPVLFGPFHTGSVFTYCWQVTTLCLWGVSVSRISSVWRKQPFRLFSVSRYVKQQPYIMKITEFDQNVPEFVGWRLKDSSFCCFVSRWRRETQDERVRVSVSIYLNLIWFSCVACLWNFKDVIIRFDLQPINFGSQPSTIWPPQ